MLHHVGDIESAVTSQRMRALVAVLVISKIDPSRVWWLQFGDLPATWRQTYVSVGPFGKSGKVTARLEVEAGRPYKPVDFDEGIAI